MPRTKDLNPTPKILFNAKITKSSLERLKQICYRRSVFALKKFSESKLIEEMIAAANMPVAPTAGQINAYENRHDPE